MDIAKHSVVAFHYALSNSEGLELENNFADTPTLYLHGAQNIIPGLENAFLGRRAGDEFEVTLSPDQAYGPVKPNQQQRMPAKYLKHEGKLKIGQAVRFKTDQGMRSATVVKIGKFSVDVDLNHPLAGQALHFRIAIASVREASPEEIQHGHAHGEGGHQH